MTEHPIIAPKKLIEVALPLNDINKACAREKSIRHGHPSTLHLWWARRPLAAARAVLFAQLVNDPSWKCSDEDLKVSQVRSAITKKRSELFKLITELVQWENTTNEDVLNRARAEIRASWKETCEANKAHPEAATLFNPEKLPAFHDPFAGGGSIPLEAQRLGLEAHATDLNPVAVLINKAMIEIPPKFAGRPPVGPIPKGEKQTSSKATEDWSGAKGLAEDVRRYGAWMREEAEKKIGHLYPKVKITKEMVKERPDLKQYEGQELTVIAWLWARTVKSPNPAFSDVDIPLVSNFMLSTKEGKETWVEPVIEGRSYRFEVRKGTPLPNASEGTKAGGRGADFRCVLSGAPVSGNYIKSEGQAQRMGARLMAIVAEGKRSRVYLAPSAEMEHIAATAKPSWKPKGEVPARLTGGTCVPYGLKEWGNLFTPRQLVALTTFSDLVKEAGEKAREDALRGGMEDGEQLEKGGTGARAYGEAMATMMGIIVSRLSNYTSTLCTWHSGVKYETITSTFGRQALPMTWDYAEGNLFSDSSGNCTRQAESIAANLENLPRNATQGFAYQAAAQTEINKNRTGNGIVSTDPPYYDNIGYADLSDYFYLWLRRCLLSFYPSLLAGLAVPKEEELIAAPYRRGSKQLAEEFFIQGMTRAMMSIAENSSPVTPISIYYAFKQADTGSEGTSSTGWEIFLEAITNAGLAVVGTWPMRTELIGNLKKTVNALASSIILVCRPKGKNDTTVSRKDFLRELDRTLPSAIAEMTDDPGAAIAPVDLAQACIGPGMAIFSRHKSVLEADGSAMTVHSALVHINKAIDNYFAEAEGDLDADTRFCIGWFQQYGFEAGAFGEADVLARAKGTSVDGVKEAGVVESSKGKARLLKVKEYPADWDPTTDNRTPIWEACHQMCRALGESEGSAGALLARMPEKQDAIRQLSYRLYTLCERQGRAEEARAYNELITSWPAIVEESQKVGHVWTQPSLLESEPNPPAPKKKGRGK